MNLDWGSVPDWLGAIGTIGAAVTALWLARAAGQPKVRFEFRRTFTDDPDGHNMMVITVTNAGYIDFMLRDSALFVGRGQGASLITLLGGLGRPISHGQMEKFSVPLAGIREAVRRRHHGPGLRLKAELGLIRVFVEGTISTGAVVVRRVPTWLVVASLKP